jgi:hypothetical protein
LKEENVKRSNNDNEFYVCVMLDCNFMGILELVLL